MPIPEILQKAWDEANLLTESGEPEKAMELLRSAAWDACENGAQQARTLRFAADAGTALGEQATANLKRHWQRAHKNYRKALNFDPKNKETRRRMNKLASMMDERAVSLGLGLQAFDEGNPTPFGLTIMLVAGMILLVSFKVIPDFFETPEENSVVTLEISYMQSGAARESQRSSRSSSIRRRPRFMLRTSCSSQKTSDTTSPSSTGSSTISWFKEATLRTKMEPEDIPGNGMGTAMEKSSTAQEIDTARTPVANRVGRYRMRPTMASSISRGPSLWPRPQPPILVAASSTSCQRIAPRVIWMGFTRFSVK